MKTFVIGDIHGNIRALQQVLIRANVDKEEDTVILLGDYCDGHRFTAEVVEEILTIKNRIIVYN
jgi:serine/threonine protein phosphatase 1